ncbi:MAG: hypothetical protein WCO09_03870 [bacterium]
MPRTRKQASKRVKQDGRKGRAHISAALENPSLLGIEIVTHATISHLAGRCPAGAGFGAGGYDDNDCDCNGGD